MSRPFGDLAFDWKPGFRARASSDPSQDDSRFSDDDILTLLRAGEAGLSAEAVCAAGGIPVGTYYRWKAKYSGLGPVELRKRRQQERRRSRTLAMSATAATAALVAAGVAYALAASAPASSAGPVSPPSAGRPLPAPKPQAISPRPVEVPAPAGQDSAAPALAAAAPTASSGTVRTSVNAAEIETADPNGLSVQVAAAPRLDDARVMLERLAALGYPSHMTTTVVNQVELYRVRVGPLRSRAVAEDVAKRLQRDGFSSPWITK